MIMMTRRRHYLDSDYIDDVLYIDVEFLHLLSISKNRKRMSITPCVKVDQLVKGSGKWSHII
ncbi:hypothetical protein I7I48_04447 [Histoplasma ohiense]|nr:hypothetical protein I7I48_04447 [Histoplasma ohiense (nom. inval.)]